MKANKKILSAVLLSMVLVVTVYGAILYWSGTFTSTVTVTGLDVLATDTTPQDYKAQIVTTSLTSAYQVCLSLTKYYGLPQLFLNINVNGTQGGNPVTGFSWTATGQYVLFWHLVNSPVSEWYMTPIGDSFALNPSGNTLTIGNMMYSFYEGDHQPTGSNALLISFKFSANATATHCEPDSVINLNVNMQITS